MSTKQLNTPIYLLILSLINLLKNIGNEKSSIFLNSLLPTEKKINKTIFTEIDLFNLISMNLEMMDIDMLIVRIKLKIDEIKNNSDSLTKEEFEKLEKLFILVCHEFEISSEFIHSENKTQIIHNEVLYVFSFIAKLQFNYSIKKISLFLKKNPRMIYKYISIIENLSDKISNDVKIKTKINSINLKLK